MANEVLFEINHLLPKWPPHSVFSSPFTTENFSSIVIYSIILFFFVCFFWVLRKAKLSYYSTQFLGSLIDGITSSQLAWKREEILKRAQKNQIEGDLWTEFDESLITTTDGKTIKNTTDASYFFNVESLSYGLIGNRFISAIPGMFTAIGLAGTFIGLQIGLKSLNLETNEGVMAAVRPLISGMAVAFSTSVWGILSSLAFNFLEKILGRIIQGNVKDLQEKIDYLFQRILPEDSLSKIESHSSESKLVLQHLAEEIGKRMQVSLLELSSQIQSGIQGAIGPAIEKLVEAAEGLAERQGKSNEEVLARLVGEFVDSVGQVGDAQKQQMQESYNRMNDMASGWNSTMESYRSQLNEELSGWESREEKRAVEFQTQMKELEKFLKRSSEDISQSVGDQLKATGHILDQGEQLATRTENSQEQMERITQKMLEASGLIEGVSHSLAELRDGLQQAVAGIKGTLIDMAAKTESAARSNEHTMSQYKALLQSVQGLQESLDTSGRRLLEASQNADQGFQSVNQAQRQFLEDLEKGFEQLQIHNREVMEDFADRVKGGTQQRLREWNEQTREFTDQMVSAVRTISDVLNDIDDKLNKLGNR